MDFNNYKSIIDFAIQMEVAAAAFYDEVSREETRVETKKMLQDFANEERKHRDLLQNLDCTGECKLATEDYKFKWITDIKRSNYMIDIKWHKGMSYSDILLYAMKREEKALALYNEMQIKSETESAKKIFKILCQEEARHKLSLEKLYDEYMAKMGD